MCHPNILSPLLPPSRVLLHGVSLIADAVGYLRRLL